MKIGYFISKRNEKKRVNQEFWTAAKYDDIFACKGYLDKKRGELRADVNFKGDNGWTALHFAALNGNSAVTDLLLLHEAEIEAETSLKFTPLIIACQKGHKEIVQKLITSGADINSADLYNNTSLHYAAQNGTQFSLRIL